MVASNNGIYNTVGASISGVTNTLTVTNPSNTASSAARETIVVGGGTAGDPTINWNVSGVTNFEMGLDNSDSDKLKISQGTALGTNDTWVMDTSGRRLLPLQPAFSAYKSATSANVTGDGTAYTLISDTELFDIGGNYNNATGVFTAPISGNYMFFCGVAFNGISSQLAGNILISTTSRGYQGMNPRLSAVQSAGNTAILAFSCIANMIAGDIAFVVVSAENSTKTVGVIGSANPVFSFFQGFLLG